MINVLSPDYTNTPVSDQRKHYLYELDSRDIPPDVSIITPFFNTGEVFKETAQSILYQTFANWEWIIVNDGSTVPESLALLEAFRNLDERVKVVDLPENRGVSFARNHGIQLAQAAFILQIDSDDLIEPSALEKWLWYLHTHPEYSFVKGFTVGFGEQEYLWDRSFCKGDYFLQENCVQTLSLVRKEVFTLVNGYDTEIRTGFEDWDFWLRCANQGLWGGTVPEYSDWNRRRHDHTDRWKDWCEEGVLRFREIAKEKYPNLWQPDGFPCPQDTPPVPNAVPEEYIPIINDLKKEKPRLLLLLPWTVMGGADKFNLDLIEQLVSKDWEVSIVTTLKSDNPWSYRFAQFTPEMFHLDNFLPLPDYPRFITYLIKSRKFDVVLNSGSRLGYRLMPYLKTRCPDPTYIDYCHIEEMYWDNGGHPRSSVLYQNLFDLNIVSSNHLKQWMIQQGADADRIRVSYTNIDPIKWQPDARCRAQMRQQLGLSSQDIVILFAGRICAQKQPTVLAKTLRQLSGLTGSFKALVAGDGPDFASLKQELHDLMPQAVQLLGAVDSNMILQCMQAADIFFLPSAWEGISLAIFEAMATGLVIVSADVGGQRELVTPDCGFLLQQGDPELEAEQYAAVLHTLVDNPELTCTMGQQARARVAQHFTLESMTETMLQAISEAQALAATYPRQPIDEKVGLATATLAIEYDRLDRWCAETFFQK